MVKIKQKKQLNLPQLIEWAWDNNVKNERYRCSDSNPYEYVWINENSDVELDEDMRISKNDTFIVEVEEEIDEDTVIDEMLLVYDNGVTHIAENKNLSFISKGNLKSAYYMNDDLRLILIWRDGKLVE